MNKQYLIYLDSLPKLINFVESSNYDDKQKIRCQKLNTIPPIIAFDKEIGGILSEIRLTYIYGCFYCSILGASAFGERILNKLILDLRSYYPQNKYLQVKESIYRCSSFTNWKIMLDALIEWNIIDDTLRANFESLSDERHRCVHYNDRLLEYTDEQILNIIKLISGIVISLFAMSKYCKLENGKYIVNKPKDFFYDIYYKL